VIDFDPIAAAALDKAESLLRDWFPAGRRQGREFVVGNLGGDPGKSLSINLNTGKWSDFASTDKGGADLISLRAAMRECSQADAATELALRLGLASSNGNHGRLTLEQYARAKGFDVEFLKREGVEQHARGVLFKYTNSDGSPAARHKLRLALGKSRKRFEYFPATGEPLTLYGLPSLTEARAIGTLHLVEGETDWLTMRAHGLLALALPGAKTANLLNRDHLEGIGRIFIHRHNDDGGDTFVRARVQRLGLLKFVGKARVVCYPAALKDANELHLKHLSDLAGFDAELEQLIPESHVCGGDHTGASGKGSAVDDTALADIKIADRIRATHGDDLLYSPSRGWLTWDGRRWSFDETDEVFKLAEEVVRNLYHDAASEPDADSRKKLVKLAETYSKAERLNGALRFARAHLTVTADKLDHDPFLLNVLNGVIDLRTGEVRPHRREDLITKMIPVAYDQCATAARWYSFLTEIFAGDLELCEYIKRAVGYSFSGDQREHCFFYLWGTGSNGKTTFLEVLLALAGDYGQAAPATLFLVDRNIPVDIARLRGARFVAVSETAESRRLDEEKIKKLTGEETISARHLYKEPFEFRPTHHLWLASNHKLQVRGTDEGIWRRPRLIPFTVQFQDPRERRDTKNAKDLNLRSQLLGELPGILRWIVEGATEYFADGLVEPGCVKAATAAYRREQDHLQDFIDECCKLAGSASADEL
jgi:putative DNA primase/helicase